MAQLKLRIKKVSMKKPVTKEPGFATRVLTNGTAEFDDIVKDAGRNTTMHKAELRMAFELCMDSVTEMLKQGYIVDLGPLGRIYPSCSSGWYEKEEDMKLSDVKPQLYYRAGEDVEGAIKSAKLVWAKAGDEEEEEGEGGQGGNSSNDNGGDSGGGTLIDDPELDDNNGGQGGGGSNDNGGGNGGNGQLIDDGE